MKSYLSKIFVLLFTCFILFSSLIVNAKESYTDLFIKISDAETEFKKGNKEKAIDILKSLELDFSNIKNNDSIAAKKVKESLNIGEDLEYEDIIKISKSLLEFEKEQNPIDEEFEKEKFKNKVFPALDNFQEIVDKENDASIIKTQFLKFNSIWTRNEAFIREKDRAYYGKIEISLSFLRSSIELEPLDKEYIQSSLNNVRDVLNGFFTGETVKEETGDIKTLKDGIDVLNKAYDLFISNDKVEAQKLIQSFIKSWPSIEGDVSTRNKVLYDKVETKMPIIMVKGSESVYQEDLKSIILSLEKLDVNASYNFVDAMLILLREGVEALLIIIALVSGLKAAKQDKGLKFVYIGVLSGILLSGIIALLLQVLFPVVTSSTNRELLEGFVGLFAVLMMVVVGIWLHSKSSIESWKAYIDKNMDVVMGSGSFISIFILSFLAVFREGAETILFYVGIVPKISFIQLSLGIIVAILLLIILAFVMLKASKLIPIHKMFLVLSWMIYILAFKMLGVSIHTLQLNGLISINIIDYIPNIDFIGLYATYEGLICQFIFIVLVLLFMLKDRFKR